MSLTLGMRAVKSFAALIELAETFVPMVARQKANEAKKAAARLSQLCEGCVSTKTNRQFGSHTGQSR